MIDIHAATEIAYKNGYAHGKADAAREIFAEIENGLLSRLPQRILLVSKDKDYTDGVREGRQDAYYDAIMLVEEIKLKRKNGSPDINVGKTEGIHER